MKHPVRSTTPVSPRVMARMATAALLLVLSAGCLQAAEGTPTSFLPSAVRSVSTIPANGDLNPYGVAFVPVGFPAGGAIHPGDVLVSNFNNSDNLQGTGTTIVNIPAGDAPALFFQGHKGIGLSTALAVLEEGLVVVGNFPTSDGSCATAQAGSLLVLDSNGSPLGELKSAAIDGPWDMTMVERGGGAVQIFVANALNGTVFRLDATATAGGLTVNGEIQIASGYLHRCDPAALVVAPTGLAYDSVKDVLYVASTDDNAVYAVRSAGRATRDFGRGRLVYRDPRHLHGPNGLVLAPNGNLMVANSDAINPDPKQTSTLVEFTTGGQFVRQISLDPLAGGAFGLGVGNSGHTAHFAAVNDAENTLTIWTLPLP
jgi:hypothetical protein